MPLEWSNLKKEALRVVETSQYAPLTTHCNLVEEMNVQNRHCETQVSGYVPSHERQYVSQGRGAVRHNTAVLYPALLFWRRHVSATVGHLEVTKMYNEENYTECNLFIVNLQYISVNTTIWYMYLFQYNIYNYSSYMFRLFWVFFRL